MRLEFPTSSPCRLCADLHAGAGTIVDESRHTAVLVPAEIRAGGSLAVLPKRHMRSSLELLDEEAIDLLRMCKRWMERLERASSPDAFQLWWNLGIAAGQHEEHFLAELVPRHAGDGFGSIPPLRPWDAAQRRDFAQQAAQNAVSRGTARYTFPEVELCGFCEYVAGRLPWEPIIATPLAATFLNKRQRSRGGMIVAPKRHVFTLTELDGQELVDTMRVLHYGVAALEHALHPSGVHVWCSAGTLAGQSQPHFHFQAVPRYRDVPYSMAPSGEVPVTPRPERLALATLLQEAHAEYSGKHPAAPPLAQLEG